MDARHGKESSLCPKGASTVGLTASFSGKPENEAVFKIESLKISRVACRNLPDTYQLEKNLAFASGI